VCKATDWFETQIKGEWKGELRGGCQNFDTWQKNPAYKLDISNSITVIIALTQPFANRSNPIGVSVFTKSPSVENTYSRCLEYMKASSWFKQVVLVVEKSPYILQPCTFYPETDGEFTLSVFSTDKTLQLVPWTEKENIYAEHMMSIKTEIPKAPVPNEVNEKFVKVLVEMGFHETMAVKALRKTGNKDLSLAIEW